MYSYKIDIPIILRELYVLLKIGNLPAKIFSYHIASSDKYLSIGHKENRLCLISNQMYIRMRVHVKCINFTDMIACENTTFNINRYISP